MGFKYVSASSPGKPKKELKKLKSAAVLRILESNPNVEDAQLWSMVAWLRDVSPTGPQGFAYVNPEGSHF